jgi:hypothetical protein
MSNEEVAEELGDGQFPLIERFGEMDDAFEDGAVDDDFAAL